MSSFLGTNPSVSINLGSLVTGTPFSFNVQIQNTTGADTFSLDNVSSNNSQAVFSGLSLPTTFTPGQLQTGVITVTPTVNGAQFALILFNGTASNCPVPLQVQWTGIPSATVAISVSPQGYSFGSWKIGTTSTEFLFRVECTSGASAQINTITFPADFIQGPTTPPTLPTTLAFGASFNFGIQFKPTAQGQLIENVSIASTDPTSPFLLSVQGFGYAINPAFTIPASTPIAMAIAQRFLAAGPQWVPVIQTPVIPFSWNCEANSQCSNWYILPFPTEQGLIDGYSYEKAILRIIIHYEDYGPFTLAVTVQTLRGQAPTVTVTGGNVVPTFLPQIAFADFNITDEAHAVFFSLVNSAGAFFLTDFVARYVPKGERKP